MSSREMRQIASRVFRTGKQTLYARSDGRFFMRLENRTNDTTIEIPPEKVEVWKERLNGSQ